MQDYTQDFIRRSRREIYADTIALARDRQGLGARQGEAANTEATNIQRIFRGNEGRMNAASLRNEKRINARNARRENEARQ